MNTISGEELDKQNNIAMGSGYQTTAAASQAYNNAIGTGYGTPAHGQFQNPAAMWGYNAQNNHFNANAGAAFAQGQSVPASQQWLMHNLQGTINGTVPSAADIQMRQGQDAAINASQSAANSNQGGLAPGLTQRNVMQNTAMMGQQNVNAMAYQRAQETASAQSQYGSTANAANQYQVGMTQLGMNGQNAALANNYAGQQLVSQQQQAEQAAKQSYLNNLSTTVGNGYGTTAGYSVGKQSNDNNMTGAVIGGVAGGVGGFFAGGPVVAFAGATAGSKLGGSV